MQTINANTAAELMLKLIRAKPWLNDSGATTQNGPDPETAAVDFMQQLVTGGMDSFDDTNASTQHFVATLLHRFIDNLLRPESPLYKKTWIIDDSQPPDEQALAIIAAEILENSDWLRKWR